MKRRSSEIGCMGLLKYPLIIEPTVSSLEVQLQQLDHRRTYWSQFKRIILRWNLPIPTDNRAPHLFGNSSHTYRCNYILGYDTLGVLVLLCSRERESGDWNLKWVTSEINGRVEHVPSLRFVFNSEHERTQFWGLLKGLASSSDESITAMIKHATTHARFVTVAHIE